MSEGYVKKNAWWYAECPKHGRTPHLEILGGMCEDCAKGDEVVGPPPCADCDKEPCACRMGPERIAQIVPGYRG